MAHLLQPISRAYVRTDPSMYDQFETQVFEEKPKRHSGIVKCPHCDYHTHRISILKRHLLVHKKPGECVMYQCPQCRYQTKYKNQLPNHIRLVHLREEPRKRPGPTPKTAAKEPKQKADEEESDSKYTKRTRCSKQNKTQDQLKQKAGVKKKKKAYTLYESSDTEITLAEIAAKMRKEKNEHSQKPSELGSDISSDENENRTNHDKNTSLNNIESKEIKANNISEKDYSDTKTETLGISDVAKVAGRNPLDSIVDKKDFERENTPSENEDENAIEIAKIVEPEHQKPPSWFFRCSACDFKTIKRSHVKKHTSSEKLRKNVHKSAKAQVIMCCSFCEFQNMDENIFKEHMKMHEKPKQTVWLCEKCSHQANSRRNLREHDIRYHRPKPEKVLIKCTFCEYRSFWRDAVKKHIEMFHNNPDNIVTYICDICAHQTKYKNNFKRHMATHRDLTQLSEMEKYTCKICYFETHDKYTLKKHLKKQKCSPETRDSMLKCPDCNFRAWNKGDITKHSIIHNKGKSLPQKMFTCHLCQYTSKWKRHVHRHVKNVHEKELEGRKRLPKNIILETTIDVPNEESDYAHRRAMEFDDAWKNTLWNPFPTERPINEPEAYRLEPQIPLYPKPSFEEQVFRRGPLPQPPLPSAEPNSKLFELNFDNLIHGTNFVEPKSDHPQETSSRVTNLDQFNEFSTPNIKDETNSNTLTPNPSTLDSDDDHKEPDYTELQTPNPIFNTPEEPLLFIDKVEITAEDIASEPTNDDLLEDIKEDDSEETVLKDKIKTEKNEGDKKSSRKKRKNTKLKLKRKVRKTSKENKKESNVIEEPVLKSDVKKEPVSKSEIGQARFNRSFKCSLCGYQNVHRSMVARHVKVHMKHGQIDVEIVKIEGVRHNSVSNKNLMKKSYKCSACGYKHLVRTMVKRHQQTHIRKKQTNLQILLSCGNCDFEHLEQYVLKQHYLLEHRVLKCHVCPFETKTRKELQDHITVHRKNEELEMSCCEICGFKTPWRDSLKKHMLIHQAPEETTWYCCEVCAFQTKHKNNLKEHLLTHKDSAEVETYRCPHCDFETKHKWRLKKHLRLKCNPQGCEMNFKCDHCNFKAYNKADVEKHAVCHVGEEIFSCNLCDYKTIVKRNFKRHAFVSHQN